MLGWWRSRGKRRADGETVEPSAELWMVWPPEKFGIASLEFERASEGDLSQAQDAAHQRMIDLTFPQVSHSAGA